VVLALVIIPVAYGQVLLLVGHAPQYVVRRRTPSRTPRAGCATCWATASRCRRTTTSRSKVGNRVSAFLSSAVASVGAIVVGAVTALIVGTSALILSVFFLLHGRDVRDEILAFIPPGRRAERRRADATSWSGVFGHFVAGQALLCAIVGGRRLDTARSRSHFKPSRCWSRSSAGWAMRSRSSA
jgi:predicted PurR-regulated permease PerM